MSGSPDQQEDPQPLFLHHETSDDEPQCDDLKGWHEGEAAIQTALGVERFENPSLPFLIRGSRSHLLRSPLFALGVTDSQNRIWSTLLGGAAGIARQMSPTIIGINAMVAVGHDPAVQTLAENDRSRRNGSSDQVLGKISGISIDLERRRRLKVFGEVVAVGFTPAPGTDVQDMKLIIKVSECVSTCFSPQKNQVPLTWRVIFQGNYAELSLRQSVFSDVFCHRSLFEAHEQEAYHIPAT